MKKITRFSGRKTISYAALSMHFPPSLWCDYRHYIDNIKLRFVLNCLKYSKTLCVPPKLFCKGDIFLGRDLTERLTLIFCRKD